VLWPVFVELVAVGRARLGMVFDEETANVEGLVEPAMIVEYFDCRSGPCVRFKLIRWCFNGMQYYVRHY